MSHSQNSTTPKSQATDVYSLYVLIGLHFPSGPGLADTRISPFWILLALVTRDLILAIR